MRVEAHAIEAMLLGSKEIQVFGLLAGIQAALVSSCDEAQLP